MIYLLYIKIPSSIIYHDGKQYYPIYKIKDDGLVGMFDSRMKFILELGLREYVLVNNNDCQMAGHSYIKNIKNKPLTPWLDCIENGIKTYEGRLNVGFWSKVKVGDVIIFDDGNKKVKTRITELKYYKTFVDAFGDLGNKLVPINNVTKEHVKKLYNEYFSDDKINQFGVVAVGITVLKS